MLITSCGAAAEAWIQKAIREYYGHVARRIPLVAGITCPKGYTVCMCIERHVLFFQGLLPQCLRLFLERQENIFFAFNGAECRSLLRACGVSVILQDLDLVGKFSDITNMIHPRKLSYMYGDGIHTKKTLLMRIGLELGVSYGLGRFFHRTRMGLGLQQNPIHRPERRRCRLIIPLEVVSKDAHTLGQAEEVDIEKLQTEIHTRKCTEARQTGQWRTVLTKASAAIEYSASHCPQLYACKVEAYLKLDELYEAQSIFTELENLEPSLVPKAFGMDTKAYQFYVSAQMKLALGEFKMSESDIKSALVREPHNAELLEFRSILAEVVKAWNNSNSVYKSKNQTLKEWENAIKDYRFCREKDSDETSFKSLFEAQILQRKLCGLNVKHVKFGGGVESVLSQAQFNDRISSPSYSVVFFDSSSSMKSWLMKGFFDELCVRYPTLNFLKVDVDKCPAKEKAYHVRKFPTFIIYKGGEVWELLVKPKSEELERSVKDFFSFGFSYPPKHPYGRK